MISVRVFIGKYSGELWLSGYKWNESHLSNKIYRMILTELKLYAKETGRNVYAYIYKNGNLINGISCKFLDDNTFHFDYKTMHKYSTK